jgi:hypothetical protein
LSIASSSLSWDLGVYSVLRFLERHLLSF